MHVKSWRSQIWVISSLHTGPLLSLTYINDLHRAILYSEECHFVDETCFLNYNSCVKSFNKQVKHDQEITANWLKTNNISLNVNKTERLLVTSPEKLFDRDLKIKLNGKRIYETDSVKSRKFNVLYNVPWLNIWEFKKSKAPSSKSRLVLWLSYWLKKANAMLWK